MKIYLKNNRKLFLPLILMVAAFFRLFHLSDLPISLFGDEVDVGYHAWSLITTGRDYMGHFLPTYIQSLAEWRAPLLMYLTAPFVGVMGPSALAIRLPVALLGIASIYLIYLVTKQLFPSNNRDLKSEIFPLLSALVLAITPWHLHYSRAAFEVVPLLFLELLATYLFISGREFISFVIFALTLYTYSTASVFTPLLVIVLYLLYRPKIFQTKNFWKFIPSILVALPLIYNIFFGQAAGRFKGISIFNDPKTIEAIILQRINPWVEKSLAEVFFHNKYFAYSNAFVQNYLQSFSPQFLFLQGDPNFRQSVGTQGELLWIFLPFLLWGLYSSVKNIKEKPFLLIILWLLLSPIASSLTQGGGTHATRLFIMLPPLVIFTALGLQAFLDNAKNKFLWILVFLLFLFGFASYWHRYSNHYRFESAALWQSGYSEIFHQLKPLLGGDKNVYVNNTFSPSLIKFALFTEYPPSAFLVDFRGDNPDSFDNDLFKGFRFGEHYFFGQTSSLESLDRLLRPGDLYLAAQGKEIPGDWDWTKTPSKGFKAVGFTRDTLGQPQYYLLEKLND